MILRYLVIYSNCIRYNILINSKLPTVKIIGINYLLIQIILSICSEYKFMVLTMKL